MFKVSTILEEFEKFTPEIMANLENFEQLPSVSIDYAVMERSDRIRVIPVDFKWSDLGSWEALYDVLNKDENNNAIEGDVIALKTENSLVYSTSRVVATIGLKDVIVVETEDAVLVCNKEDSQDVKRVYERLKK